MPEDKVEMSRRGLMMAGGLGALALSATGAGAAARSDAPTARLFSTTSGQGRPVVFLHGWTCDSQDWCWQYPPFESRYRVIAPDLRGHGRSEVMPSGHYAPADYVADVEALIQREAPGQRVVLIGHSMGGQIAARVAQRRPDLVDGVVSIDGSLGFDDNAAQLFAKTVRDMTAGDPAVVVPALFELVYGPKTDPGFKQWHARRVKGMPTAPVRESFGPLFFGPDQVGIGDASARFCESIQTPVYHLCRDAVQAGRMRPWFHHRKSKVDVWTGVGHWIMQDQIADVNAAVTAWIDQLA